jgi:DNA adenine methylase
LLGFDWPRPHLSDVNEELVATYRGIRDRPAEVRSRLRRLRVERDTYDRIRRSTPGTDVDRAVRLLYLNRCGYGGIYRTDKHGTFNVPFSGDRSTTSLWSNGRLTELATALSTVEITCGDFAETLALVDAGAVVYCDPVYTLPETTGLFGRYSPRAFSWADQLRLAEVVHDLRHRGALVIVSNSSDDRVAKLFGGGIRTTFDRRVPLPKARGTKLREAVYVLGDRSTERAVRRRLNTMPK